MHKTISVTSSVVVLLGFSLFGCAYGTRQQNLAARFANELDCPEAEATKIYEVMPKDEKVVEYRVEGCSETRLYACTRDEGLVSMGDTGCREVPKNEQMQVTLAEDPSPEDLGITGEGSAEDEEGPGGQDLKAEQPSADDEGTGK